jgi:sulfatase maturation enzyme AslB (radical SAM superfamily)
LKVAHYLPLLEQAAVGRLVVPPHIEINPVNFCNHDCYFCSYRAQGDDRVNALFEEKAMLRTEDIMRILDEAEDCGVQAIQFCGGGEPTLHPDIIPILCHTKRLGLKYALVTNGSRITEDWKPVLEDASWIRVSIDAASVETYQKVHVHSRKVAEKDYAAAWGAVRICSALPEVTVGVSFIVTPLNWQDIFSATNNARQWGASNIRIGAEVYTDGRGATLKGLHGGIAKQIKHARELETPSFKVIVQAFDRMDNVELTQYAVDEHCWHHHLASIIGADGMLYGCCIKKYGVDGAITSVLDKPLYDAFTGEDHLAWSRRLEPWLDCRHGCFLKPKNDVANHLVGPTPPHIEFV